MAVAESALPDDAFAELEVRRPVDRARHLPGYLYASEEIFAREKSRIFLKDWVCFARVEEVAEPGDYLTDRLMGEPFIVARDEAGALAAFANVCAHRGVEVAAGAGNATGFSCPYHGWRYDLAGRLVGAPYMGEAEGFDPDRCRLKPLGLGVWAGWIFINFDPDPEPFARFIAEWDRTFAFLRLEDCRTADKYTTEVDCNWKLVVENFVDYYHINTLHADTLGALKASAVELEVLKPGVLAGFYPHAPLNADGELLFGMMPWLAGRGEDFSGAGTLSPNLQMFLYGDNVQASVAWPMAPGRTRIELYSLFPEVFFGRGDFRAKIAAHAEMVAQIIEEDRDMVASLQRAMATRLFQPGHMCEMEGPVHHLINYNLDRIA